MPGSTALDQYHQSNSPCTGLRQEWPVKVDKAQDRMSEGRRQIEYMKNKEYDRRDAPVSTAGLMWPGLSYKRQIPSIM